MNLRDAVRCLGLASALAATACTLVERERNALAWQRADCNRRLDMGDRERCMRRAEEEVARRYREREAPAR